MAKTGRPLRHIVCIEDDPDIREIARISLAEIGGLRVHLFGSGGEAIAQAPALAPDMFLIDIMMPDMDGMQTMAALHRHPVLSETPVVFLTAKVQDHEVEAYRGMGAAAVISKPFDPLTLADRCRTVWARVQAALPAGTASGGLDHVA